MKNKIVFMLLFLPFIAQTQVDKKQDSLITILFNDLIENWTLGVDSNNINLVDIRVYNKFKNLFDTDATIEDDLNVRFIPGIKAGTYKTGTSVKDFDVYAHDVALEVSKLRIESFTQKEKVNDLEYKISRKIYLEKPRKYVLKEIDSLAKTIRENHTLKFEKGKNLEGELLENLKNKLKANPDSLYKFIDSTTFLVTISGPNNDNTQPVKIKSIQIINSSLSCLNDGDLDAVLDFEDLSEKYGDFTASGAPDTDLDGVPDLVLLDEKKSLDKCRDTYGIQGNQGCPISYFIEDYQLEGNLGIQVNIANINLPELNQLGYKDEMGADAMDVNESAKGIIENPGNIVSMYTGADFSYFFNKGAKKNGISIGFSYSRFTGGYEVDSMLYTFKSFDGFDSYRRQISFNSLEEEIAYNMINIPVQYVYRFKIIAEKEKTWIGSIKAGPSLMIIKAKSDYNVNIDFGGIYQIDSVNRDRLTYNDFLNRNSGWNVYLTKDGINRQNDNPGAAAIFEQLNRNADIYDFAVDQNYNDKQNISRKTVAFNFSFDAQYKGKTGSPVSVKMGAHFVYAPLFEMKDRYKPIERTTDRFNSIFNSNAKSSYMAYGASFGLVYSF